MVIGSNTSGFRFVTTFRNKFLEFTENQGSFFLQQIKRKFCLYFLVIREHFKVGEIQSHEMG